MAVSSESFLVLFIVCLFLFFFLLFFLFFVVFFFFCCFFFCFLLFFLFVLFFFFFVILETVLVKINILAEINTDEARPLEGLVHVALFRTNLCLSKCEICRPSHVAYHHLEVTKSILNVEKRLYYV